MQHRRIHAGIHCPFPSLNSLMVYYDSAHLVQYPSRRRHFWTTQITFWVRYADRSLDCQTWRNRIINLTLISMSSVNRLRERLESSLVLLARGLMGLGSSVLSFGVLGEVGGVPSSISIGSLLGSLRVGEAAGGGTQCLPRDSAELGLTEHQFILR